MLEITDKDLETTKKVIEDACKIFNVSYDDVLSLSSLKNVSLARNYCYYVLHYTHNFSARRICLLFKRRNVRGVFKMISKTKYLIENTKYFNNIYNEKEEV